MNNTMDLTCINQTWRAGDGKYFDLCSERAAKRLT